MAVRNEAVRVSAHDDGFTSGMARFATAAAVFGGTLDSVDGSGMRVRETLPGVSKEVEGVGRSMRRNGPEIDRYSGRVRILADVMAILGPSAVPIGAIAVPAVTGLAAQLGFAAIGASTLIAASQGVGEALKAVNEAAIEPTAANLEKAEQAMERLGPDAREFVTEFQRIRPTLTFIRDASASGWFPGLTESLDDLERLAPRLASISEAIGARGGSLIAEGADNLAGPEWAEFWDFVEHNAPDAIEDLMRTVGNLTKGMANMWMAFDPTNDKFGDWLLEKSREFERWSDELAGTNGYREFIDYIETNGPRVADSMGAIGNAILQIIEAVSPLGGPSLKIIEIFGDAVAAMADSDLGTPILAGVAALALYSRGLQAATALQTRLFGGTASAQLAQQGAFGFTRGFAKDAKAAIPTASQFGTVMYRAGQSSKYATDQTLAARSAVRGFAAQAAKGAAPVAGLALATSGVADSFGLANTASFGLMGSIAGPWGAAIGAGIGLMKDLDAATIGFSDNVKQVEADLSSGALVEAAARLAELRKEAADSNEITGFGDMFSDVGKGLGRVVTGDIGFLFGADEDKIKKLERFLAKAKEAKDVEAAFAESLRSGNTAALAAEHGLDSLTQALARHQTAALAAIDGQYAWGAAVIAAREQMKNGKDGFDEFTQAGQENMTIVRSMATAWNENMDALREQGTTYSDVRGQIVRFAVEQGMLREEAQELARDLLAVPDKIAPKITAEFDRANFDEAEAAYDSLPSDVKTNILANGIPKTEAEVNALVEKYKLTEKERRALLTLTDKASAGIQVVQNRLDGLRDKNVTVTTTFKNFYDNVPKPGSKPKKTPKVPQVVDGIGADGTTVPKTGLPYADRHLYMLADGEEVISNRFGQADRGRKAAKLINAGLLTDDILGLATGGTAGRSKDAGRNSIFLPFGAELPDLGKGLRGLEKAIKKSEKALDRESDKRDAIVDKMDSARSSAGGAFLSDIFAPSAAWSGGSVFDDVMGGINRDNAAGALREKQIAILKSKGLDGAALVALMSQEDPNTIADFVNRTAGELDVFEKGFNRRSGFETRVGNATANAAFGKELAKQTAATNVVANEVRTLQQIYKQESKANRESRKRGTGKASRSIKRSKK